MASFQNIRHTLKFETITRNFPMILIEISKELPFSARINNEKNICASNQMEIKLFEVDYCRSNKFYGLFSSSIFYFMLVKKSSRIFKITLISTQFIFEL